MNIDQKIKEHIKRSIKVKQLVLKKNIPSITKVTKLLIETYWKKGGTIYLIGNGGSACDASHFAQELVSAFRVTDRWSLAARSLSDNGAIMSAIGNDFGFEQIFARQIQGLAKPNDLVIAFSTSGNSKNIIKAIGVAKLRGIKTIGFTGKGGGMLASLVDVAIIIPSNDTSHIQESHMTIAHALCAIVEELFFKE